MVSEIYIGERFACDGCIDQSAEPIKAIPTICFDCHKKGYDSPEEKKMVELTLNDEPMGKKRLMKLIAVYRATNDLENMQKYQLMLDKLKLERIAKKRKRIAELTQNGDPTDIRSLTELKELYYSLGDGQNTKKYNTMAKQLKSEWWEENVKPNLNKKSVVESKLVPKKTPINVNDTPVNKAKRKRIVKSFVEPENLESEVEPADDGFFYGYWDE
jgi:hypothetical protein